MCLVLHDARNRRIALGLVGYELVVGMKPRHALCSVMMCRQ